jgi:hypothetical protein
METDQIRSDKRKSIKKNIIIFNSWRVKERKKEMMEMNQSKAGKLTDRMKMQTGCRVQFE